jgi:hypothetical protein
MGRLAWTLYDKAAMLQGEVALVRRYTWEALMKNLLVSIRPRTFADG